MFKAIKNLFTGGAKAPQQSASEYLFSDQEVQAIKIANNAIMPQLYLAGYGDVGKINNVKHVTAWTVGYMIGVIDFATRVTSNQPHATYETARLFLDIVFDRDNKEVSQRVAALMVTCQHAMRTGDDLFMHGQRYCEGGQAGFDTFPKAEGEAPKLSLYHALKNGGYPPQ